MSNDAQSYYQACSNCTAKWYCMKPLERCPALRGGRTATREGGAGLEDTTHRGTKQQGVIDVCWNSSA